MRGLYDSLDLPLGRARVRTWPSALLCFLLFLQANGLSAQKPGEAEEQRRKLDSLETALRNQSGEAALETRLKIAEAWFYAFALPEEERVPKLLETFILGLEEARRQNRPDYEAFFYIERSRYLKWQPDSILQALDAADSAIAAARKSGKPAALAKSYDARSAVYMKYPGNNKSEEMAAAGEQALEFARASGDLKLLAGIYNAMHGRYRRTRQDALSAARGESAFVLFEKLGANEQMAMLSRSLGLVYAQLGDEQNQLKYLEKFFELADNLNYQTNQLVGAWLDAGNLARENYQPEQALYFYRKCFQALSKEAETCNSLKTPECRQNVTDLGVISFNMAATFRRLEREDSNRAYLRKGAVFFERVNNRVNVLSAKLFIAASRAGDGAPEAALTELSILDDAIDSTRGRYRPFFQNLRQMIKGIALTKAGRPEEALPGLRGSIPYFTNGRLFIGQNDKIDDIRKDVLEAWEALEGVYWALGKPDSAQLALASRAISEQFRLEQIIRSKEQELIGRFDLENKNKEISGLSGAQAQKEAAIARRRAFIWSVSGGAAVFALLLLFAARNVRAKRQANKELRRQKAEIGAAFEEIRQINDSLKDAYVKIEKQHEDLADSIVYARRIQRAALPRREFLHAAFPRHFLYYQPRDVVSGDFYWFAQRDGLKFIAVCDCTGHGVPGAFMSILGASRLDSIVQDYGVDSPDVILSELDRALRDELGQYAEAEIMDGIDLALCAINPAKKTLLFSGAGRPLWLARKGKVEEFDGARCSTGGSQFKNKIFTLAEIDYKPGDRIYMFSDGITDQFGGPKMRKFAKKRLRAFIEEHAEMDLRAQGAAFRTRFDHWRAPYDQLDDMTLLALELS